MSQTLRYNGSTIRVQTLGGTSYTLVPGSTYTFPDSALSDVVNFPEPFGVVDAPAHSYNGTMEPVLQSAGFGAFVFGSYNPYLPYSSQLSYQTNMEQSILLQLLERLRDNGGFPYAGYGPYVIIP